MIRNTLTHLTLAGLLALTSGMALAGVSGPSGSSGGSNATGTSTMSKDKASDSKMTKRSGGDVTSKHDGVGTAKGKTNDGAGSQPGGAGSNGASGSGGAGAGAGGVGSGEGGAGTVK